MSDQITITRRGALLAITFVAAVGSGSEFTLAHDLSFFTPLDRMTIDQFKSLGIKKSMRFKRRVRALRLRPPLGVRHRRDSQPGSG